MKESFDGNENNDKKAFISPEELSKGLSEIAFKNFNFTNISLEPDDLNDAPFDIVDVEDIEPVEAEYSEDQ